MAVIQWLVYKPGLPAVAVFHPSEKAALSHADSIGPGAEVHRTDFWYDTEGGHYNDPEGPIEGPGDKLGCIGDELDELEKKIVREIDCLENKSNIYAFYVEVLGKEKADMMVGRIQRGLDPMTDEPLGGGV